MTPVRELTVELDAAISTNAIFANRRGGGRGRIMTAEYVRWKRGQLNFLLAQKVRPVLPPVAISILLPETSRIDIDNSAKGILDLLVKAGIIEDDNKRIVRSVSITIAERKGVQVTVKSLAAVGV